MSLTPTAWLFIYILLLLPLLHTVLATAHNTPINGTCDDTCGTIPIKYPFGTGFGCGHPVFARYIKCSSGTLQFSTGTGIYTISSIDYPSNTIVLTDPLMSTCSSMQNSGSFILDRTSPFTITSDVIFVLLGCSTTSPVFDADEELCDTGSGSRICRGLYSCKGVTGIGLPQNAPVSTCCVYDSPLGLGSGYALDLPKLQCSSYTSIYGFGDDEGDPMKWKFGISLQYNDSYDTETCKDCEASGGLCGFAGLDQSFACGLEEKIIELENLMGGFGFSNKRVFFSNLISGYVKLGNLEFVSKTILRSLKVEGEGTIFGEETYCEVVKGFLNNGGIKGLATLIIKAQKLEASDVVVDSSVGYGIVNACVKLGLSDKAHSILEEMDVQGGSVGLGVYVPILKAYCKEHRTAEATQLVMEISNLGLQLDVEIYDALIEASMSSQDFPSAFSLFRDMREARIPELKGSYLTIMTGLMENHRPELMAAFLDEVVEDPRIEVGTHDWNSIIHAFCKSGRLEDARRTLRRMIFLQFEPNDQTYLSLINGYVTVEKYFSVLMLWNEVKRKVSRDGQKGIKFDHTLVDAFLYALVKGGFFDAVMQVVEKTQEMKIFVDKWRYKQAFMETHKKLKVAKLRKRNFRKMESLVAFKNWAATAHNTPINGTCDDTCGTIPIKYPFGTGFGCGHPVFARYIKCSSGTLQFSTGTGIYTISSIDYPSNTIVLTDPLMSTCSSMQNSGSFILDRTSPFTITSDVIFVLLGCSTTSPVFDADEELCDTGSGSRICRGLYSCKGVTGIGLPQNAPVSTCCVYDSPLGLGSGYALDLPKLQCSSYTSIYGFGDDEGDPMKWKFGISLQYNDSYDTETCKDCEASGGLCGFAGLDQSFACVCKNGANSSNNCLGRGYAWSGTWGLKIQLKMILGGT
ncbi:pentatricopeptide repeat-containing protein [Quercus suber]|uniref:non-specific serine/threonine protein kinase n=1 Tax=Quercus suber TaxID=58331 RepID=A0AAW0JNI1_QUESU